MPKDEEKENLVKKLKYPKSVFFIVGNEFCERFSYYGMRAILSIYLTDILFYTKSDAKIVYHTFNFMVYFFPLFGAMLADSLLGKFHTILWVSMIYAAGNVVLSLAAAPTTDMDTELGSMFGLLLIAIGTGGIKPCVSAFGGDQFKLPEQALSLARFFSLFYFSINLGSLLSTIITPIIRENVQCFEQTSCFTGAFAVPAGLMIISIFVFIMGKPLYTIKKPEGNMVIKVSKCITTAISEKRKSSSTKDHWLDHAEEKHGKKLVSEVKILLKVLLLYIPLPVFWALFDQQGSGWTFQARMMNGDVGFYNILPDQMQVVNPFLILVFIPVFQYVVYPIFDRLGILKKPLQRLTVGGVLAAASFFISAGISLALENEMPTQPASGIGHLRIYNTMPCDIRIDGSTLIGDGTVIPVHDFYEDTNVKVVDEENFDLSYECEYSNSNGERVLVKEDATVTVKEKEAVGYYFSSPKSLVQFADTNEKDEDHGYPKMRTLVNWMDRNLTTLYVRYYNNIRHLHQMSSLNDTEVYAFKPSDTYVWVGFSEFSFVSELGVVYVILATPISDSLFNISMVEVTKPNNVHMLWQLPQYLVITMGEIMFSITGLEFAYNQAPTSMKSVIQACWLLTTAVGNLLVVIIEALQSFEDESSAFFLYASLMVVDMGLFAFMAYRYVPVQRNEEEEEEKEIEEQPSVIEENEIN